MNKKNLKHDIDVKTESPIIDQTNEIMKKLITKGKRLGFLNLSDIESELSQESSEIIEEFQSKVSNLGIQIYEDDTEASDDDREYILRFIFD